MQTSNIFGTNAALLGKILSWTALRELGPLFAAVLVISRSGVAMTSELATMKLTGEIDTLKRMGINPIDYLIVPPHSRMCCDSCSPYGLSASRPPFLAVLFSAP